MNRKVRENVDLYHKTALKRSAVLKHLVETVELKVIEAVYHLTNEEVGTLAEAKTREQHHTHTGGKL